MNAKDALARAVYTGNDVGSYTLQEVDRRIGERENALVTGIGTMDRYLEPVMAGELTFVLAYTSHGKTAFMQAWARNCVKQLHEQKDMKRVAVYISWETIVEELGLYDLAGMTGIDSRDAWHGRINAAEREKLALAAFKRAAMPLWVIGYSLKRRREIRLTIPVVSDALREMEELWQVRPAIIFVDYLQQVAAENPGEERRSQIMRIVDGLQMLARDCGCPVVAGSQAGRQVLAREFMLPEIGDGQESSRQEQDADKVISLWYPCKTKMIGERIDELALDVTEDLMVMGIRKQRHAASGQVFPVRFDPAHNTFTSWT